MRVFVRNPRTHCACPRCQESSKKVHQHHIRRVRHSIWQDKRVILFVKKRRFFCSVCAKPFSEVLEGIDRKSTTTNFRNILKKEMSVSSLRSASIRSGVSFSILYGALREHSDFTTIDWEKQKDNLTIGIDEHSFRGKRMALTVTNITEKKVLSVEEDDSLKTLEKVLESSEKEKISEVCIDMKRGFLNTIECILPKAIVTVDKYHVIACANQTLDEARSVIVGKSHNVRRVLFKRSDRHTERDKEKLAFVFEKYKKFPSLYQAWFVKEKVHDFYRSKDMKEAKRRMKNLILFCEESDSRYVQGFGKTLIRWRKYILNHFVKRSTSAYTEGVHTRIKMIKRMSFGFRNIHNYIAKIMLAFMPFLWITHHTIC